MTAASLATIITAIQLGIQAAQGAAPVVAAAKTFIDSLFAQGVISVEQQNAAHDHILALETAALAGNEPPSWIVQPDPVLLTDDNQAAS